VCLRTPVCFGDRQADAAWAQFAAAFYFFSVPAPSTMYAVTFGYGGGTSGTGVVFPPVVLSRT
jgi:hypothetical protein